MAAQAATGVDSGATPAPKRESRVVASNLPSLSSSIAANLSTQASSVGPRAASTASRLKSPPYVTRVPTPEDPLRVMILGDSVTYEIAPPLEWALESSGVARVEDRTQVGLGLSRWPIFHWWEVWQPFIEEIHPEVVVVQMGIWDASRSDSLLAGMRRPAPEEDNWEQDYGFLLDSVHEPRHPGRGARLLGVDVAVTATRADRATERRDRGARTGETRGPH